MFVFVLSLFACAASQGGVVSVGFGGGNTHFHDGERGGYGRGGYYNRGGYFYGNGWVGPNVIINVPAPRYYVPLCENVEVCDQYGQCWLERYCD